MVGRKFEDKATLDVVKEIPSVEVHSLIILGHQVETLE